MPKITRTTQAVLDRTINHIVGRASREIAQAVRRSIVEEVSRLIDEKGAHGTVAAVRKRARVLCPVPGCGKVTGGPRWGWFCAEHKELPEERKAEFRANRQATARARRASRNASKARRLLTCPFPGCHKPGKGPRFGWFCEDHRTLPKEERDRIRADRRAKGAPPAVVKQKKGGRKPGRPAKARRARRVKKGARGKKKA